MQSMHTMNNPNNVQVRRIPTPSRLEGRYYQGEVVCEEGTFRVPEKDQEDLDDGDRISFVPGARKWKGEYWAKSLVIL